MLRNAGVADIGDVIRAYDFKPMVGRNDCFVEGEVHAITNEPGYKAYKIVVSKDVFDGQVQAKGDESRINRFVFVPFEVSFMEYDGRIINLSK